MKIFVIVLCAALLMLSCSCELLIPGQEDTGSAWTKEEEADTPAEEPAEDPPPPPTPPTPTPVPAPTPDSAGSGDMLFDIYTNIAYADIDNDGTNEELIFTAGGPGSALSIDGVPYPVNLAGLAQLFAITDIDIADGIIEIVFTDEYDGSLGDTEFPFSWIYWFDGTDLVRMGGLMDMKFAGAWRAAFDPADHFDGHGMTMCLTRTEHFTDIWYIGHYEPTGAQRELEEDLYAAVPINDVADLTLKSGYACILLYNIDNTYFDPSYAPMWDYASWPHINGRVADPAGDGVIILIAVGQEVLEVTKVYGKLWTKLKTADGYTGWVKVVDNEMWGYKDVMHIMVQEMFDGIVIAG